MITFSAPFNGGSVITAYKVTILSGDGSTYLEDLNNCDASTTDIMTNKRCTIPFGDLRADPFNLPWGSSVYAKIAAINLMGTSLDSVAGNGAEITRVPDPPINLVKNTLVSNAVTIGIQWDNGLESGGVPVLDYRVWYDQGTDTYMILDYEISDTQYVTTVPLTSGTYYTFKVQSRNLVGFSDLSEPLAVFAAQMPDEPNTPVTTTEGLYVKISWNEPND